MTSNQSDFFIEFLKSLSGRHVAFFPKSGNAGDGLIAYATYILFDKYNISYTCYSQGTVVDDEIVLIGGGGNLVEGKYEDVAKLVWQHRNNSRVVILPHTIFGYKEVIAETNNNLEIFCREPVSYNLALLNGANKERTYLAHDVTFYLDDEHFDDFLQKGEGILYALRTDGESSGAMPINNENIDISLSWNGDLWKDAIFCKHTTYSLASYIKPFENIVTDRLHISILSSFLRKNVSLMPNDYFKNQAIYEHSMKHRFPNVKFINTSSNTIEGNTNAIFSEQRIKELKNEILLLNEAHKNSQSDLMAQINMHKEAECELKNEVLHLSEMYNNAQSDLIIQINRCKETERELQVKQYDWEEKYTNECKESNARLNEIFESTTWKLAMKMNKLGSNMPGFIRKTIRWILRR